MFKQSKLGLKARLELGLIRGAWDRVLVASRCEQDARKSNRLHWVDQIDIRKVAVVGDCFAELHETVSRLRAEKWVVQDLCVPSHVLSMLAISVEVKFKINNLKKGALCDKESIREVFLLLFLDRRVHRLLKVEVLNAQVSHAHPLIEEFARHKEAGAAH